MRKLQICSLILLAFLCASCHKDKDNDVTSQPMAYCMTDAQRSVLSNMKPVCDSLYLVDFGDMDYRLDELMEVCTENPDYSVYMNKWAHGMYINLPENIQISTTHTSCTAYAGHLADGAPVMGRNLDVTCRNPETGAMLPIAYFAVHTAGIAGTRYASIGFTESTALDGRFSLENLKDGKTDISMLAMLPYIILDGINEKGLAMTMLTLFGNPSYAIDGVPGNRSYSEGLIIRPILDKCETVEQAIAFASTLNPQTLMPGNDLHYLVTDANGHYAILEWVKAVGGYNELQVVTDIPCVSNRFCSPRAKELSQQGLFADEAILSYEDCYEMAQGKEEYMQRYFNMTLGDTTATFNQSINNCIYRLASLENAYNHPEGGVPGVFANTDEAMKVLASAFFSRTDGPITMTPQGSYEKTIWSCIYNNREKSVTICLNENERKQYHFSFDQFTKKN